MGKSLTIATALGLLLASAGVYAQADVIYVPTGFPDVCGSSLTTNQARCPEAVTAQAGSFCGQGLRGLDAVRSALGVPNCQGNSLASPFSVPLADSVVQLVLLIDDTGTNSQLLNSLEGTLSGQGDRRMVEPSFRVFSDSSNRSWRALVVGERMYRNGGAGGQQMSMPEWQDRIRRLVTGGGPLEQARDSARLPGGSGGSQGSSSRSTAGSEETASGRSAPSSSTSRTERTGERGTRNTTDRETQSESGDGLTAPAPSDDETSVTFEQMDMPVPFKRSFVQWRDDVGRALAREISGIDRSQAYSTARNSDGLRRYHSELSEAETPNGELVLIPVMVMRNDSDSSIDSVGLYDDDDYNDD